jgi:uncharacterized protein (TIGR03067 family)
MKLHVLALLAAGLLVTAALARDDEGKKEKDKLNGTWSVVSIERDGKKREGDEVKGFKLVLQDGKYTLVTGDRSIEGTYKVNASRDPKAIDATRTSGKDKDQVLLGVYKLEDEKLSMCFNGPGKEDRPKEFSAKEGSGHTLYVLKREKP